MGRRSDDIFKDIHSFLNNPDESENHVEPVPEAEAIELLVESLNSKEIAAIAIKALKSSRLDYLFCVNILTEWLAVLKIPMKDRRKLVLKLLKDTGKDMARIYGIDIERI
jgi:intracellular sulfur oxidation DsrE/DsrF family protein